MLVVVVRDCVGITVVVMRVEVVLVVVVVMVVVGVAVTVRVMVPVVVGGMRMRVWEQLLRVDVRVLAAGVMVRDGRGTRKRHPQRESRHDEWRDADEALHRSRGSFSRSEARPATPEMSYGWDDPIGSVPVQRAGAGGVSWVRRNASNMRSGSHRRRPIRMRAAAVTV